MNNLETRNPGEKEFLQATREVLESIVEVYNENPQFEKAGIIERLTEPDRVIVFKVPWQDDEGVIRVNRGFRVQFNNTLGPYKGGLRFHPNVNLSIMKFLGFEQIFKNSLTGLPLGGGKGGSDFDPKGKSNAEVMRFCQSFMMELYRHIGPNTDIPAGGMGVGGREIGFLYGQYKRIVNRNEGVLTGKGLNWGGSWIRKEATGYGLVYLTQAFLNDIEDSFENKTIVISGSGNVAIYAAEKIQQLGGNVVAMSDSNGFIYDQKGIDLDLVKEIKEINRGRMHEYKTEHPNVEYNEKHADLWKIKCDIALPCAAENEIDLSAAQSLKENGCICIGEGANMPVTYDAGKFLYEERIGHLPGKAANAGGVAVSGLEMTQNAMKLQWGSEEVDRKLRQIMSQIHLSCVKYGKTHDGLIDYVKGANITGFLKVAFSMLDHGL